MTDVQLDDAITTYTALAATVAAHRLLFIAEKTSRTYTDDYDTVDDTEAAWKSAAAEVSLASDTSHGRASNDMEIGLALATRLPKVAELLLGGQISEYIARRIVHRTTNIVDPDLLATVEAHIAEAATTWGALSVKKLDDAIDVWVNRYDPAAVRQVRVRVRDRGVEILETKDGVTEVLLRLTGADAALYWQRITAMAKGVCPDDPRTLDQRRADAHGALGAGFFHLACQCGNPDCPAAADDDGRASHVVVHIYTEAATLAAQPDPLMDGDAPLPPDPRQPRSDITLVYPDGTRVPLDGEPEPARENQASHDGPAAECRRAEEHEVPGVDQASPTETRVQAEVDGEAGKTTPEHDAPVAEQDAPVEADNAVPAPCAPNPPPGILVGFGAMPAPLIAALIARGAPVRHLTAPGTDPEQRYRPSTALQEWTTARDLTCRFPNCDRPAEFCEYDHTTPWPAGKTHASGGKMYCKLHHFGKTFWAGWTDSQAPDGTITITTPTGQTYTSKPASRLYFPTINTTSAPINTPPPTPTPPGKINHIPTYRKRNHARQRAYRINAERKLNDGRVAEATRPPPF
ncbi:HNH endonuclease [Mycolicibacterium murale]|uniref:HNH endonuclease n=2 Tax=Mycolicibacterium murale TaxID=182220 RepID=A0A7I9WG06_9MYCO|nr:HNH endonuclease [Mycolicibacterium murale]